MMPLQGEYLGMSVAIPDVDRPNQEFYTHCGQARPGVLLVILQKLQVVLIYLII